MQNYEFTEKAKDNSRNNWAYLTYLTKSQIISRK